MNTPPSVLYKYLDAEGAIKTLGNLSLKFSSPLSLNDPFEGQYGDISDTNKEEQTSLHRSNFAVVRKAFSDTMADIAFGKGANP